MATQEGEKSTGNRMFRIIDKFSILTLRPSRYRDMRAITLAHQHQMMTLGR